MASVKDDYDNFRMVSMVLDEYQHRTKQACKCTSRHSCAAWQHQYSFLSKHILQYFQHQEHFSAGKRMGSNRAEVEEIQS